MTAMAMASGAKNHKAMMKSARKVPNNTVFFMEGGQMYMVSGTLDLPGTSIGPDPRQRHQYAFAIDEAAPCGRPAKENNTMPGKSNYRAV